MDETPERPDLPHDEDCFYRLGQQIGIPMECNCDKDSRPEIRTVELSDATLADWADAHNGTVRIVPDAEEHWPETPEAAWHMLRTATTYLLELEESELPLLDAMRAIDVLVEAAKRVRSEVPAGSV